MAGHHVGKRNTRRAGVQGLEKKLDTFGEVCVNIVDPSRLSQLHLILHTLSPQLTQNHGIIFVIHKLVPTGEEVTDSHGIH